jgi:hypothetical protein
MWANPRRLERLRVVLNVTNVVTVGVGALIYSTGDIKYMLWIVLISGFYIGLARYGFRCERCGKSPLLWSARHNRASELMDVLHRPECPYCGYDGSYPHAVGR